MSATVKTTNTLDITFHVIDGTAVGNQFTWKFDNPTDSVGSLSQVRTAFAGPSGFLSDYFTDEFPGYPDDAKMYICDASGNKIDMIDAAKKVSTVITKEDLG